jgi:deoxyribonuclease IV
MVSSPARMKLGAHVSTAGGVGNAPANAEAIGADCMQVFTRNQNRWSSKPIGEREAGRYRAELERVGVGPVLAHDSYLINLAGDDPEKLARSTAAFGDELTRAQLLGIPYLVAHPGSHLGAGVASGLERFAANLDRCLEAAGPSCEVTVLLETTAGQGSNLGFEFGQLRDIIGLSRWPDRIGICVDTCHVFAAGYDLRDADGYEAMVEEMETTVGLDRIRAWHLNDSKRELGSRVDRHADPGEGHLGWEPFRALVNDPRWAGLAGCLETPGGPDAWRVQIEKLRALAEVGP